MREHADIKALERLFDVLATGTAEEIKALRPELNRNRYSSLPPETGKDFVLKQMERVQRTEKPHNRAALIRGLIPLGFEVARHAFTETIALALAEIQHPSGTVREAARKLADYLRFEAFHPYTQGRNSKEEYRNFVRSLGELLAKHRGNVKETHIEDLHPSVYRSVALLFHDLNTRGSHGTVLSPEETAAYRVPVHASADEAWEGNEIDIEELKENIWSGYRGGDPERALPALTRLEKRALAQLRVEIQAFGFPAQDAEAVAASLRTGGTDYGPLALMRLMMQAVGAQRLREIEDFSGVVRALQGFSNHMIQRNLKGEPFSDLLVNTLLTREEYGRHIPKDFVAVVHILSEAHDAIDLFCTEWKEREEVEYAHIAKALTEHGFDGSPGDPEWDEYRNRRREEARSIAHHVLDWYMQAEPWNAARPEPRKLAAIAIHTINRINWEWRDDGKKELLHGVTTAELSAFGGWASPGGVNGPYGVASAVMREAADPGLFYLRVEAPE